MLKKKCNRYNTDMLPPSPYFQASVSLQPRMHQMPLCTPKNKNVDQRYICKEFTYQAAKDQYIVFQSYHKRHEGSSFPIVTFVPLRLQTYASIGINQSLECVVALEMAQAPVRIQHCIFRIQLDRLHQKQTLRTKKHTLLLQSQTGIIMCFITLKTSRVC
jgi:hypothetical protein